jgi:hypothetical protein
MPLVVRAAFYGNLFVLCPDVNFVRAAEAMLFNCLACCLVAAISAETKFLFTCTWYHL